MMTIPFDAEKLDNLMEAEGVDMLVASSKHNVQYLLGGYRFFFFDVMDAIGLSRYLPLLVYPRGRPEDAAYFANVMEPIKPENNDGWPPLVSAHNWGTRDAMAEAIAHIETYGSSHTESIITDDPDAACAFQAQVDSAIVMHNASTQFADGGEFGMGAEIGIATGRMHARGPVGVEQLTSFKYCIDGSGQTRP